MNDWKCAGCGEDNKASFEICWNCGGGRDGSAPAPAFVRESDDLSIVAAARELSCLRCHTPLRHLGHRKFHEGSRFWPTLGDLGELFVNRESFDIYVCTGCGKIEFFAIR